MIDVKREHFPERCFCFVALPKPDLRQSYEKPTIDPIRLRFRKSSSKRRKFGNEVAK